MTQYSGEFKASLIAKMLPPNNVGVPQLSRETGIPKDTLYCWRLKHRRSNGDGATNQVCSREPSSEEKFTVVMETASLNEIELGEYCRRQGLYPEQIRAWRKICQQANASAEVGVDREKSRQQAKEIKQLQSELRRKDKALAETAALLVLQKKARIFLGEPEDGK
jgi:transposase